MSLAKPKISIIVPVYNTAKYINRLVDSITSQDFSDFELLLIDDGSSDDSYAVCKDCSLQDKRIKAIHKQNGGVSSARNTGIGLSKGEWLWFVDSDDYIMPNALTSFVDAIDDEVDIIRGGLIREKDGIITKTIAPKQFLKEVKEDIIYSYYETGYAAYLCNTLFRRELIGNHRLDERISWCEDHLFHYGLIGEARKVKFLAVPVYYYDAPSTSLTSFGTNLSSKYLEPAMIMRCAHLELNAKLAYLPKDATKGIMIANKAFENKAKLALKFAVVGGKYVEAIRITHKYLNNNFRLLFSNILHIKIAPLIRKLLPNNNYKFKRK